jgi:glycosyltransferase involved in cell wall biosynthesis
MKKLSVLIPSRNERFLTQTVADILSKATGDIEVIAVLDGVWADPMPADDPRLSVIHFSQSFGMRRAINSAAAIAKGDYLMKCDAHCSFEPGFDEILLRDIEDNWIVIPRRDRLDAENWCRQDVGKPPIDLHYLSCPLTNLDGFSMHGAIWKERDRQRLDVPIDETPSFQGSFWMMSRRHWDWLGGMSEEGYGGFTQEPQEIGLKTWLGGGQVMVNKNTTYLHLHKGRTYGRGYHQDKREILAGHEWSARYWMNNKWEGRVHDFEWFVEKFMPMPTWPTDWQEQWERHEFNERHSIPA